MNKRKPLTIILFTLLLIGYLLFIYRNFKFSLDQISVMFGYADTQHHWRLLDDFVNLKMPFRDYFNFGSYGWVYLLIQSPVYLLFGRSFMAMLIIEFLYLPLLAVTLSYFVAKNVLRKNNLIIVFLFLCLLFAVNSIYTSPRHLIAELSLSLIMLYLLERKRSNLFWAGVVAGLSLLSSSEYGLSLNITVVCLAFISIFSDTRIIRPVITTFLPGQLLVLTPFFLWISLKGVLRNYWEYTFMGINNFYHSSPCGEGFPRIADIESLSKNSKLLIFSIPVEYLQKLNFYLVFIAYLACLILISLAFYKNKKLTKNLVILGLTIYGLLAFVRTLDTPCTGYFTYGLVPLFLILILIWEDIRNLIRHSSNRIIKALLYLCVVIFIIWTILTENTGTIIKIFGTKIVEPSKITFAEEYYPPAGWYLRKDLVIGYKEISTYVEKNTDKSDFIYTYPWGPHNQITGRTSPNSIPTAFQFFAGDKFVTKTVSELSDKKPKLVVINLLNNLGSVLYGKNMENFYSFCCEDGPLFSGLGNEVEKYILENYEPALKNNVAVIMKPRLIPVVVKHNTLVASWKPGEEGEIIGRYLVDTGQGKYRIIRNQASWALKMNQSVTASEISVKLNLKGSLLAKHLSRFYLTLTVISKEKDGQTYLTTTTNILARRQTQAVNIGLGSPKEVVLIKLDIGPNIGLAWWLIPHELQVEEIIFKN
ncbi:MAG: hypothetical protein UW68_C0002G0025 [Candidatus Collierbacteria bacterium GW2011_GWB1_44_6]|uniref:Glycosyltransferase RgtA/B/C/D-like domain-containing protein n=2 Tax=Candidatus Collieribacteriota TaxID=1752725 RepID=A0A0G1JQD5_9BACT|nr:MAG: hypothetical protein UV68_C0004G0013 [Candidatus Collierbacteria bacterium GW2011_GWC2_43_12]KKT73756.1 MAG: hypothetical protein UW68_C0002G0025 [Candidatus Collierbacteria bacterium GW2011_GWB1_44_6]